MRLIFTSNVGLSHESLCGVDMYVLLPTRDYLVKEMVSKCVLLHMEETASVWCRYPN